MWANVLCFKRRLTTCVLLELTPFYSFLRLCAKNFLKDEMFVNIPLSGQQSGFHSGIVNPQPSQPIVNFFKMKQDLCTSDIPTPLIEFMWLGVYDGKARNLSVYNLHLMHFDLLPQLSFSNHCKCLKNDPKLFFTFPDT